MYLIALTFVGWTISPVCLQHTVLEATTLDASGVEADIAQEFADDPGSVADRLPIAF